MTAGRERLAVQLPTGQVELVSLCGNVSIR